MSSALHNSLQLREIQEAISFSRMVRFRARGRVISSPANPLPKVTTDPLAPTSAHRGYSTMKRALQGSQVLQGGWTCRATGITSWVPSSLTTLLTPRPPRQGNPNQWYRDCQGPGAPGFL